GFDATCAVRTTGTLWCWGRGDSGQVGDGTLTQRTAPVQVGAATTWAQVSAGNGFACARRTSSSVWCWGTNTSGQLGDGTTTQRSAPVLVPSFSASRVITGAEANSVFALA